MKPEKEFWIDTRLPPEIVTGLRNLVSEHPRPRYDLFQSEALLDKDNWFFKSTLKKLTERLFYRDWDNFSKYHVEIEEGISLPEFEMNRFWVNYMKQHAFVSLHDHTGLYSFVVFIKIPTDWKEQQMFNPSASNFEFVWSEKNNEVLKKHSVSLSSEDEGRILFFPAWLQHKVYPFYECEEERITLSGNVALKSSDEFEQLEEFVSEDEKKEKIKEMMHKMMEERDKTDEKRG